MSSQSLARFSVLSIFIFTGCHTPNLGYWSADEHFEDELWRRERNGNGIEVGELKIYDDYVLRLMLDRTRQQLAAIKGLNEATLIQRLGTTSGARIEQSQFGLQATGPSSPAVTATAKGATTQTTTDAQGYTSVVSTVPSQDVQTVVSPVAPPSSPVIPPGMAFTPPTGVLGSALDMLNEQLQLEYDKINYELLLSGSDSDTFIGNQRLLKSRTTLGLTISLTPPPYYHDAVAVVEVEVATANPSFQDDPPTIVTLLPRERTYNVAAITDRMTSIGGGVVVGTVGVSGSWISGSKKHYMVKDQDTLALMRPSRKPSDEEVQRSRNAKTTAKTTSFAWEFRPVLGQKFVREGIRQTFAQLAFPRLEEMGDCFGTAVIRTYWREFDQKSGMAKGIIKGSALRREIMAIPRYDLTPRVRGVNYQDLGDGNILVKVKGSFLADAYVQLGPKRHDATTGLRLDNMGLTFIAPADALARWTGRVISRDGKSADILDNSMRKYSAKLDQFSCLDQPVKAEHAADIKRMHIKDIRITPDAHVEIELAKGRADSEEPTDIRLVDIQHDNRIDLESDLITRLDGSSGLVRAPIIPGAVCPYGSIKIKTDGVKVSPLNESTSLLKVEFEPIQPPNPLPYLPEDVFLDIGHSVFGLTNSLVERVATPAAPSITAVVPTSLLVANRKVRAFRMFWTAPDGDQVLDPRNSCFTTESTLAGFSLDSAVERLALVAVDDKGDATYLLYGNGIDKAEVLPPQKVTWLESDHLPKERLRLLKIEKSELEKTKKLMLVKAGGKPKTDQFPLLLDIPRPEAKPAQPPKVTLDSPVIQNTDELDVSVERVGELKSVKMGETELKYEKGKDFIRLVNLRNDGVTSEQRTRELTFEFNDKTNVTVKVEVVAARVGVK